MYDLQLHTRRLLQETAVVLASSPPVSSDDNHVNTHFSPSMAIDIFIILLTIFVFMAFFFIYIKRSSSPTPAAPPHPIEPTSQGVDPAVLEALPLVSYSISQKKGFNTECLVCFSDFKEGEPLCRLPRCEHLFHKNCIDKWLFSRTTCPACRLSVISDARRSFRLGVGSGRLRLSMARSESGRGSATGPSTPITPQAARLPDTVEQPASFERIERDRLRRSHSLVKQGESIAVRVDADSEEVQPSGGCLAMTRTVSFQRLRSFPAMGDGGASVKIDIGGWMRENTIWCPRALNPPQ